MRPMYAAEASAGRAPDFWDTGEHMAGHKLAVLEEGSRPEGGDGMFTLQIEHGIKDFGMWKAAFDRDPVNRAASGVLAHRIGRPVDDAHYVVVELDFATRTQAEQLLANLESKVWNSQLAAPALAGAPQTRIVESAG
jgi:hypothetical protein